MKILRLVEFSLSLVLLTGCSGKKYSSEDVVTEVESLPAERESVDSVEVNNIQVNDAEKGQTDEPDVKKSLEGYDPYHFSKDYFLKDSLHSLHYEVNLAVAPHDPIWIKRFVNEYIQKEPAFGFLDENVRPRLCPVQRSSSWKDICNYYFKWLKKEYVRKFAQVAGSDALDFEFKLSAYPVWEDEKMITYQFYLYEHLDFSREREQDFCRTFDKSTGRALGIEDFYTASEFAEAETWLGKQLDSILGREGLTADVDPHGNVFASSDRILKEKYKGKVFPRPAIIPEGIIFTYQTYEKGGGGEGIIKVVKPYSK
ncbi:MAG: hypothetical protein K2H46_01525 [Muribaculaceae bacterium]|nr:hypothetical protein [Muribaculaceae bacterium]